MNTDPFDVEMEPETIVPSDMVPNPVQITPIASEEDFKQRLTTLSPDDLALALALMLDKKTKNDASSQTAIF